ncbi:MAG: hypothetical protein ACKVX7_02395 [Planctomycetota bacterium]
MDRDHRDGWFLRRARGALSLRCRRALAVVLCGVTLSGSVGCTAPADARWSQAGLRSVVWHLASGPSAFEGLADTFDHLRSRGKVRPAYQLYAEIGQSEGGFRAAFGTLFGHVIGPYDFSDLTSTVSHLRK